MSASSRVIPAKKLDMISRKPRRTPDSVSRNLVPVSLAVRRVRRCFLLRRNSAINETRKMSAPASATRRGHPLPTMRCPVGDESMSQVPRGTGFALMRRFVSDSRESRGYRENGETSQQPVGNQAVAGPRLHGNPILVQCRSARRLEDVICGHGMVLLTSTAGLRPSRRGYAKDWAGRAPHSSSEPRPHRRVSRGVRRPAGQRSLSRGRAPWGCDNP